MGLLHIFDRLTSTASIWSSGSVFSEQSAAYGLEKSDRCQCVDKQMRQQYNK